MRLASAFLCIALTLATHLQADARARLIGVFPLRSTKALAPQAADATRALVGRLSALDGYDAKALTEPKSGSLGAAAAEAGAEVYVVGQIVAVDGGFQISVGSFRASTDKEISEYKVVTKNVALLPADPDPRVLVVEPSQAAAPPSADTSGSVTIPTGTPVEVRLDSQLSSGSAKVGDKFAFKAFSDVVVDGWVVVQKGAEGQGEVALVEGAGGNGHAGKLGLQFDWIAGVDGAKIPLSDTQRTDEGEQKKGAASTATIATYVLLGPLGLFAHNFVRGRDVTLDENSKLRAYVDHTVHVASQTKESVAPGYAR
jgi:hypothetical protein